VDIVRLSLADLEWLYPGSDARQIIQLWLGWGPSLCLLTLGSQGASGYTSEGIVANTLSPSVKVVDTVGAGDTFQAATLNWLYVNNILDVKESLRSVSPEQLTACLEYAVHAAAINCSRAGAKPPFRHEMANL